MTADAGAGREDGPLQGRLPSGAVQDGSAEAVERVVTALAGLPGVAGIVLGGSRARGTAVPGSDVDIGLYYRTRERPAFASLVALAQRLDDDGRPRGAGTYGEWGPWINGGVWLQVGGFATDVLLRDVDRVRDVVQACSQGRLEVDYQPGHPHAFVSSVYAAEVFHNVPLHDPRGLLAELRALVDPYPHALAVGTVRRFLWEAGFALGTARAAAGRGDTAYVTGCAFRAVSCLVQVLHAVNRVYLPNEKGAVAAVDRMPRAPHDFSGTVGAALTRMDRDPAHLVDGLDVLASLVDRTAELAAPLLDGA